MIRSLTFRPGSSFLNLSAGLSGSWWPRAHWPWPRCTWPRSGWDDIFGGPSCWYDAMQYWSRPVLGRARARGEPGLARRTTHGAGNAHLVNMTAADQPQAAAGGRAV